MHQILWELANIVVNHFPELYDAIIVDVPYLINNDGIDEIELFALNEPQDPLAVYTYTWFDGSGAVVGNSDSLITKSPGKYEAFVEKLYPGTSSSCLSIRTVFVGYSSLAQIETVDVEDLSNNNSILITVFGAGLYICIKSRSFWVQIQMPLPISLMCLQVFKRRVKTLKTIVGMFN